MKRVFKWGLIAISVLVIVFFIGYFVDNNQRLKFNNRTARELTMNSKNGITIDINREAPVIAKAGIEIHAPVEQVWNLLTDIKKWPQWQSGISTTEIYGKAEKGTTFKWESGGISFESVIHTSDTYQSFGWTGTTYGAQATHNWTFREEEGKTFLVVEESLEGILPALFKESFRNNLETGMAKNLKELKTASER